MGLRTAILILYLVVVNVIGFLMMGVDKNKARRHKHRISEKALFIVAIIGGSVGSFAGMYTFRHKTRHMKFVVGIPVIIAAQIIIGIALT